MQKYDHKRIEEKWQRYWEENKIFQVTEDSNKPKKYVLDMFPYPSGAGLHVGHVEGYTATDIVSRYLRQKGFNVLHPMGWDSFGLPAEQYAVRTGTHPEISTKANIDTYRRQLKSLGFSYDWSREFATSDSSYYKWTQWIFTKLVERGLAYEAEVSVNYCPFLGTVLANEEVENGVSKEGSHPVIRKPFRQWMLKITAYAERLIEDLEDLDWPEHIKQSQLNWIGKSSGASIHFPVKEKNEVISVYTTRPETLFGATFLVLAPEHPLVDALCPKPFTDAVEAYREKISSRSDLERTELNKEKTGVFIGAYALNPATKQEVPIWIADYVLPSYGTGAVMATPGHDSRDYDFAKKHDLPIKNVVLSDEKVDGAYEGDGLMTNSENEEVSLNGLQVQDAKEKISDWLESSNQGERKVHYKLRDWLFSRQRYWAEPVPILHFEDGTIRTLDLDELPLTPPELTDYKPCGDGQSPLAKVREWVEIVDAKTHKKAKRETNTMPQWAGSCWYYLRFCDPRNALQICEKEKQAYWLPVDLYIGGVEHAVLHLLYARFWHKVLYDIGVVATKEPFISLKNPGIIVARSYKNNQNAYVDPNEVIDREGKYFWKKTGEELVSQIEKMSKSKLNGVGPDEIIDEYGADALRLYEMFMGPLDKEKIWNSDAVGATRRFLSRVYDLVFSDKVVLEESEDAKKLINRLVAKITLDMEHFQFNTAIAKMMEFLNDFSKLSSYPRSALVTFTQVLMPFAPHIAEELWQKLGSKEPLNFMPYPKADEKYLQDNIVTFVIQVNGKLRARIELPRDEAQDVIVEIAKEQSNVQKFLYGKEIKKMIFVPNKLLNFVVA